jgi:hypothetical protein
VLAVAGALAVWCSHPATFVLGGIGTALLARAAMNRRWKEFLTTSAVIGCWLASFAVCYFLCLRQLSGNSYLTDYWAGHFLPLPPKSLGDLAWMVDHFVHFFTIPGGFGGELVPLGGFAAVLALVGLREFARERWPVAVALAVSAILVLLASALHKYPIGGRLMLFMVPAGVLLVARGASVILQVLWTHNRFAACMLAGVLVVAPLWESVDSLRRPTRSEELAPVLQTVRAEMQPGDRVYVYPGAEPAFVFYTRGQPFPAEAVTFGKEHQTDLANLRGRVWVIISHPRGDEETVIRTLLDTRGRCEYECKQSGASAYLYRLEE